MLNPGTRLDLYIESEASEMANYDGWGNYDGNRVNVYGHVEENETTVVQIVSFEGGSYFAEAMNSRAAEDAITDDSDIRGSKKQSTK